MHELADDLGWGKCAVQDFAHALRDRHLDACSPLAERTPNYGGKITGTLTSVGGMTEMVNVPIWPNPSSITDQTVTASLISQNGTGVTLIRPEATGTIFAG